MSIDVWKATGADGIMSAEGLLYNPALFSGKHIPVWILCSKYLSYFEEYGQGNLGYLKAHFFKMLHHVVQEPENVCWRERSDECSIPGRLWKDRGEIREKYEVPGTIKRNVRVD